jgi:hypothetical protein
LTPFDREDGAQIFIAASVLLLGLTTGLFKAGQIAKVRLEKRFPPPGSTVVEDAVVAIDRARQADPPIPVMVRAPTSLDVDHLRDVDGVELFIDEVASADRFRDAVLGALEPTDGHGSP